MAIIRIINMNNKIRKIFVLAGGDDQISLIKELRLRFNNAEIILIDKALKTLASKHADRHLVVSTLDLDAVLTAARDEKIDLIITACGDQTLPTMAYVSEQLNLPCYLTYEQSINLTNKLYMKRLMIENSIPTSRYVLIDNKDIKDDLDLIYPLVVKPVDNNGSKGIVKVYEKYKLKEAIGEAFEYTRTNNVIVEEFKNGVEFSIEAFIENGEPIILIETKLTKVKQNTDKFTILKCSYPSYLSENVRGKIKTIIKQIGKAFDINNVPLMVQLIVNNDEVNVVEFSARTGGGSKHHIIREISGVNIFENLLDITFGIAPNLDIKNSNKLATINYVYAKRGVFTGVKNLDFMKHQNIICDYYFYKLIGSDILSSDISSDRPVGFLIVADSEEDLNNKVKKVDSTIQVLNEMNEDIMVHDLY